ncbi:MAG: hypothetical protein AB7P03_27295 [Kofleriaceae bacterium]
MRTASVVLVVLMGCGSPVRPRVMPTIDSLPDEQPRRDERLRSIEVRPGPETRPRLAPKLDAAETAAATAAALLGIAYSTSRNVELGLELNVVEPDADPGQPTSPTTPSQPAAAPDPNTLVPWVTLPSKSSNH